MCVGQNTPVTAQRFFYDHAPAVTGQVKGTGHFFETLSVGSVPGTDHS